MRRPTHGLLFLTLLTVAACERQEIATSPQPPLQPTGPLADFQTALDMSSVNPDPLSGGATTVFDSSAGAFGLPAPNLDATALAQHTRGDVAFDQDFVAAPGLPNSGLGPLFNNNSCSACHVGDGRGQPPAPGQPFTTMLFRASIPGSDAVGGPKPAGQFGGQLQLMAIPGFTAEASAQVFYVDSFGRFGDGTRYSLAVPHYSFAGNIGPLPGNLLTSPRVAPVNFGLGLLRAIPEATLNQLADPFDNNHDGISGRVNTVFEATIQRYVVGRFGWKANVGTLTQQTAGAYNGDMGVTTALFPAENCEGEFTGCARHAPEISSQTVDDVAFYTATLGVPARRNINDPTTQLGEAVFKAAGCGSCHTQTLTTGVLAGVPSVSNQRIHAYTDLLLHDMGAGLADNRPDFDANGREFRTPPLWGVGLIHTVNGHTTFLHDGRARNLEEAVLWHGGEGTNARERFKSFPANYRRALVAFLQSL
ncbi:MAG: di-heme oxidoredictase family protein [bacterium]